jgi:hypothetical protein
MLRYLPASLAAGFVLVVSDAAIHANPLAVSLYAYLRPIARSSVNPALGTLIDFGYGFALAALFVGLRPSLPGGSGWSKALSFALVVWFLRVVMGVLGSWMTTTAPATAHAYTLVAGLVQVLLVSVVLGSILGPGRGPRAT